MNEDNPDSYKKKELSAWLAKIEIPESLSSVAPMISLPELS